MVVAADSVCTGLSAEGEALGSGHGALCLFLDLFGVHLLGFFCCALVLLEFLDISCLLLLCVGLDPFLILSITGHCCADPVATGTDTAIAVHLSLSSICIGFVLQGTLLLRRVEGWVETLEELLEAEFPVSVFIRKFDESIDTQSSKTRPKRNKSART